MDRVSIGRTIIMPYQYMLFDLDGTLTDPGLGITNSVMVALRQMGAAVPERSALYPFIGPPLQDSFRRFFGFTEEQCQEAIRYYREYFKRQGIFENEVYEGIRELLAGLKKEGKTLAVATSKPEVFAIEILKYFDLFQYFDLVAGATLDGSRSEKADVIRYALEQLGLPDKSTVLMVGDREHDILGAKENGLASIGVLYGYGSREELRKAGAAWIVETPEEILSVLSAGRDFSDNYLQELSMRTVPGDNHMKVIDIVGDNYLGRWTDTRTACRAIIIEEGKILLSYEVKTDQWMLPGGGLEEDEEERTCVVRETAEETGFVITPSSCLLEIDEYYEEWKYVNRYFAGRIEAVCEKNLTEREKEVGMEPRWMPIADILGILAQHQDYAGKDEMRRGLYLREYTALKALLPH